nr:protein trichome birefringence-like 14 isoform X1 [Ipomoea batatas]
MCPLFELRKLEQNIPVVTYSRVQETDWHDSPSHEPLVEVMTVGRRVPLLRYQPEVHPATHPKSSLGSGLSQMHSLLRALIHTQQSEKSVSEAAMRVNRALSDDPRAWESWIQGLTEHATKYGVDLGKENTSMQAEECVSSKLQENFINTNISSQRKSTKELTTQTDVEEDSPLRVTKEAEVSGAKEADKAEVSGGKKNSNEEKDSNAPLHSLTTELFQRTT